MKIAVVGAGYVSGACLADFGREVVCVDLDPKRVASLNDGVMPVFGPGLEDLVSKAPRALGA